MLLKTKREIALEEKLAALKREARELEERSGADFSEDNRLATKVRPIRKHVHRCRFGDESALSIVDNAPELIDWLIGVCKRGERITMTVVW